MNNPIKEKLKNQFRGQPRQGITECVRCCACCVKGGPAFHLEDRHLIDDGKINTRFIYTIRQGEPVEDNVKGGLTFAETDIIKIKNNSNTKSCLFLNLGNKLCSVYENRPAECRVLKCWDTKEIVEMYDKNRLTRQDLLGEAGGLWDLIAEHQRTCSYEDIRSIMDETHQKPEGEPLEELLRKVRYDLSLRSRMVEQVGMDPNMIDFLLGNPLKTTLARMGIQFRDNKTDGCCQR